MHTIIIKQGFMIIVVICYICSFRNPAITILKVVGSEDCVRESKLPLWGLGGKAPAAEQFFQKNSHLDDILHVFRVILQNAKLL